LKKYVPKRLAAKNYFATLGKILGQWQGPLQSECAIEEMDLSEDDVDDDDDDDDNRFGSEWTSIEVLVLAPREWSRESHKTFSANTRAEIRVFLLVNLRMGKFKLGRDLLPHLFQFVVCDEPWAPVFRLHQYVAPKTHPVGRWTTRKRRRQ
jgi:hypothetical protein